MAKIVLDLHDIYNKGSVIDAELNRVIADAIEKHPPLASVKTCQHLITLHNSGTGFVFNDLLIAS